MTLLEYLYKAEGNTIHYNKTESDITSPGGIYRYKHPSAKIFTYIDNIANSIDIMVPSKNWTQSDIEKVNNKLTDKSTINDLVMDFYNEYNKNAHLEKFTESVQTAMFSLYTNSPANAWKSVQSAINKFHSNGIINYKYNLFQCSSYLLL